MTHPTRRRMMIAGIGAALGISAVAFARRQGLGLHKRLGVAFGTAVSLTVLHAESRIANAALDAGFAEIRAVEKVASLLDTDSDICRLNRDGMIQNPDARLLAMLHQSTYLAGLTGGAFDVSVQPYWLAWASAKAQGLAPSKDELQAATVRVGQQHIVIDRQTVRFARPGMGITLNGIARGYATGAVMDIVRGRGIEHAFLDIDEIGANGSHEDRPWTFAIQHPRHPGKHLGRVAPLSGFLSTSGDYATTFSPDFRDNHIFMPDTGRSPTELSSATVISPNGAMADGLSTALMILGAERGLALLQGLPGAHAVLVRKNGEVLVSPGAPFVAEAA